MGSRYRDAYVPSCRGRSSSPRSRRYRERSYSPPPPRRVRRRYEEQHRPTFDPSTQFRDANEEKNMTRNMLSEKERDSRTIFVWQLASKVTEKDVYDLFSRAGKVRDVRLIIDKRTGRHKGAGYIEFYRSESVQPALSFYGQLIRNFPIAVKGPEGAPADPVSPAQRTVTGQAPAMMTTPLKTAANSVRQQPPYVLPSIEELARLLNPTGLPAPSKPTLAAPATTTPTATTDNNDFKKLYVGSVPFNVTNEDLRTIFEPFGKLKYLNLQMDPLTQRSKGYGFMEFYEHESAVKALSINGIVVAGRPLKIGLATTQTNSLPNVTPTTTLLNGNQSAITGSNDDGSDKVKAVTGDLTGELDQGGASVKIDANRRHALMAKLSGKVNTANPTSEDENIESSHFIKISNMFEMGGGSNAEANWMEELIEEVSDECNERFGKVLHLRVEPMSKGCVYVMFEQKDSAKKAKLTLQGRWFGGRLLGCAFVGEKDYRQRFQDVPQLETK